MTNLNTFDLNLLRALDALIETRSATRAGAKIGLSQPAVSAALGRLRVALGDPLFVRIGPRLEPTDHALSLAAGVRAILEQTEAVISGPARFDPATSTARFRISGSDFFAAMLMPILADHLARHAPGLRVQLVDLVPDNHASILETQTVDLALIPQFDGPSWMEWQPLFHAPFAMIARRDHPRLLDLPPGSAVPLDRLCALDHILFSPEGNLTGLADTALAKVGARRRVVMTLPVMQGVCNAVAESDRVAIVPRHLAEKMQVRLALRILALPMPMPAPLLGMVWHRRRSNAPSHKWLRDCIAQLLTPLQGPDFPSPPSCVTTAP